MPLLSSIIWLRSVFARSFPASLLLPALVLLPGCAFFQQGADLSNFRTVVIDPGHGGFDHGAHAYRGMDEKDLTLDVGLRLRPLLQKRGYHVVMTRTTDVFIPLGVRTAISNAHRDAVFVSIHCNMSPSSSAYGVESYYYDRHSAPFAGNILREIAYSYGSHSRGVKYAGYFVLHHNLRPATLLELGFISNPQEDSELQNPAVRQLLAEKIAIGISKMQGGHAPPPAGGAEASRYPLRFAPSQEGAGYSTQ
jgi:N-acetylmuramoyl-L-alanine amidase